MKGNLENLIKKINERYPEAKIDFSEAVYVNNRTKMKLFDRSLDENGEEYGEFWMAPTNLLNGQSHPKKRVKKISMSQRAKQDEIIERFKEAHKGENLDYSQVEYINMHTKVKIICHELDENGNEYGEFWQEPVVHLKGCSHPRLGQKKSNEAKSYNTETFIKKCKELYGEEKYNYDNVEYVNSKTKVAVFCNKCTNGVPHGIFYTSPDLFLQGKGCPICGHQLSKNENELYDFICSLVGKENVIHGDTKLLEGKEIDIYIPSKNFAIEYNGLRWHTEKFGKDRYYHLQKTEACNKLGVTLYQIFEDEYLNNKTLVNDKIKNFLNLNNGIKIGARNCLVKEIDVNTSKEFLNKYHIQGFASSTIHLGAYYNNELVGVMSFKKEGRDIFNLTRFTTNINYICQGIGSKLFNHFIKTYNPVEVKTFLDRRWTNISNTNLYDKLGFKIDSILAPNYSYTLGQGKRFHKFGFRKQILHKKYGFPLTMNETEMTHELGYEKIWDCGLIRYVWKKE